MTLSSYGVSPLFFKGWVFPAWVHVRREAYGQGFGLGVGLAVELDWVFTIGAGVFASPFSPEFDCLSAVRLELGAAAAPFPNHSSSQTL